MPSNRAAAGDATPTPLPPDIIHPRAIHPFRMIDVQHITQRYGQHTAIDRVTFSVAKGEVLAFLGPNGAGKTTTMRILTCFMPATEGTARVAGFDCTEQPLEVKRQIGYL